MNHPHLIVHILKITGMQNQESLYKKLDLLLGLY